MKDGELQSRREFFKQAAKGAMPMLAIATLGPTYFASCDKDDDDDLSSGGSISGCGKSCSGGCDNGCSNNCDSLCGGDCWAYCESKARS